MNSFTVSAISKVEKQILSEVQRTLLPQQPKSLLVQLSQNYVFRKLAVSASKELAITSILLDEELR